MVKAKTFVRALSEIGKNPHKVKQYFSDKRLTQSEKQILEAYYLYRDNRLQEAEEVLAAVTGHNDPVVCAVKDLITGTILTAQSRYKSAISHLEKSAVIFHQYEVKDLEFKVLANIFVTYLNLNDSQSMNSTLKKMKRFEPKTRWQTFYLMMSQLNYFIRIEKFSEAEEVLEEIDTIKDEMTENDLINYLITKFDFAIKKEDFDLAKLTLAEMKRCRKYHLTANYNFIKTLLEHYLENTPLYIETNDYEQNELLLSQIKLIKALEERDNTTSKQCWERLRHLAPSIFDDNFNYTGNKCLFSICFYRHIKHQNVESEIVLPKKKSNKYETLKQVLIEAKGKPIQKEKLHQLVWGNEIESKECFQKIAQYIYRLKTKDGLNIKMVKGCYLIEQDTVKKAS